MDRVFDESLNFRKIPPVIPSTKPPEINGKPPELRPRAPDSLEPRALRRRTWNREDVRAAPELHTSRGMGENHLLTFCFFVCVQAVLDSLMLNSVSQLSSKIRHSVDKTAGKIRSERWLMLNQPVRI